MRSRCSTQGCSPGIKYFCKGTDPSAVRLSEQTCSPFCHSGRHIRNSLFARTCSLAKFWTIITSSRYQRYMTIWAGSTAALAM
ncbi:hypothetical protein M378DRAFT_920818 [Amanita muscaria Koide BX008]|uniref:Uncharacterized protein n=1 Tax=Amanita muscaria (strain Koide BX008) TaxID=946122 RepID=A0A0C2SC14_AMAMK|nr:hypothetical protein M378DRAFT_920818 [Amanita muscaria Koide BX008]